MYFVMTVLYCHRDCLSLQSSEHTSHAQPPGRWMEPSWDMQCPIMDQRSVFPEVSNQSRFPVSLCGGDDRMWWGYVQYICRYASFVGSLPPSSAHSHLITEVAIYSCSYRPCGGKEHLAGAGRGSLGYVETSWRSFESIGCYHGSCLKGC